MNLKKATEEMKFDIRLIEFNLAQGLIKEEDLKKRLESLQDTSHQGEFLNFDGDNDDDDGGHTA